MNEFSRSYCSFKLLSTWIMGDYFLIGIYLSVFYLFSMTGICKSLNLFSLPIFCLPELGLAFLIVYLAALGDITNTEGGYGVFSTIALLLIEGTKSL